MYTCLRIFLSFELPDKEVIANFKSLSDGGSNLLATPTGSAPGYVHIYTHTYTHTHIIDTG